LGEVLHCLARAIIIEDDTILLAHEKQSPNTFLPGGHVEFGDSLISTIERELVEELGLECTVGQYLGAIEHSWSRDSVQHMEVPQNRLPFIVSCAPDSHRTVIDTAMGIYV